LKILITGGTGFIGGHFINMVPDNIKISAIKRSNSKSKIKINRKVKWVEKDLTNLVAKDLNNFDCIVHFASSGVSPQIATKKQLYNINVNCTKSLLKLASETGIGRVIMAGSCIEYGLSANKYKKIPSHAALLPTTAYGSSKAQAFNYAYKFCKKSKISLIYNRIFFVFGEGQYEGNLWPSLKKAAITGKDFPMTTGEQIRDFISVKEVASAFLRDLSIDPPKNFQPQVKNICSGKGVSTLKFANYWWKKWNAKGNLLPGKIPNRSNEPIRFVGKL